MVNRFDSNYGNYLSRFPSEPSYNNQLIAVVKVHKERYFDFLMSDMRESNYVSEEHFDSLQEFDLRPILSNISKIKAWYHKIYGTCYGFKFYDR